MNVLGTLTRLEGLCERITFVQRSVRDLWIEEVDRESCKTIRQMFCNKARPKMDWSTENIGAMIQEWHARAHAFVIRRWSQLVQDVMQADKSDVKSVKYFLIGPAYGVRAVATGWGRNHAISSIKQSCAQEQWRNYNWQRYQGIFR